MKTTLDLPEDLVKAVKLLALHDGNRLNDAVADLLWKGLAADPGRATVVKVGKATLRRRREMTAKFVSGEWGLELADRDAIEQADRKADAELDDAWRE